MPVTLDPDAAAVYKAFQESGRPPYETVSPAEARELYLKARVVTNPEPPELKSVEPLAIPAPHGAIPARIYTPKTLRKANGLAPCLVFFHGGGWVIGDLDSHDVVCRKLADEGQLIVIAVDYRLAPEHKFPAAVDDAVTATKWIADNAKQLGVDVSRLLVGGDSAGGNLAAVVAIAARDGDGPAIAGQVLIYPAIDFAMTHPSHSEPETSILLTHSVIRWFRDHYLNGAADVHDWRASPARARTLIGLPPAYVLTAGADPLRDEGDEYAHRLKQAGVPVTYRHFSGQFHGFFTMGKLLQQANVAATEIGAWLKALNQGVKP
jgi:acetyl esterase